MAYHSQYLAGARPVFVACPDGRVVPTLLRDLVGSPARIVAGQSVTEVLEQADKQPVLVLLAAPGVALAQLLDAQMPPQEALQAWMEQTDALWADLRRVRRRVILLDRDRLQRGPLAALLNDRFGLKLSGEAAQATPEPTTTVSEALAALLLQSSDAARQRADEFEAMLALPGGTGPFSVEQMAQVAAEVRSGVQNPAHLEELDLLREDVVQLQQELERRRQDAEQRAQREATLETVLLERDARLKAQKEALDQAHEELQAVYNSRSWRVTEPMRAARRKISKR